MTTLELDALENLVKLELEHGITTTITPAVVLELIRMAREGLVLREIWNSEK